MSREALDLLGRILMRSVRDESVNDIRQTVSGGMKGTDAEQIRSRLAALNESAIAALEQVVPDLVDQVIHNLLAAVEQNAQIEIVVRGDVEVRASEASDGLAGELYGGAGWIARFSEVSRKESN